MPYIKQDRRNQLRQVPLTVTTAGELNYVLTVLSIEYFKQNGSNYQAINDVIGALEGAKLEFYRRLVAPYEDKKITENGDIY